MKRFKLYVGLFFLFCVMYACSKEDALTQLKEIKFIQPTHFPKPFYQFEGNPLSNDGFELGKKLFYDARLSADGSVSCGSCHQQFAAFANLDHQLSHGVHNCLGKRNAPTLVNLAWQTNFFWDGGAKNLEIVPLNAITDACEMGSNLTQTLDFLNRTAPYPQLFKTTFGSQTVNSQLFLRALTQFMATMVSANSKYDQVMKSPKENSFTESEKLGYEIFKEKCESCHTEPLFTNNEFANNGLTPNQGELGRKTITGLEIDLRKFRIPTLRNIELSAPYMHDGRFNTLEKVLNHYESGIISYPNLSPLLLTNGKPGIALTNLQKQQLISFLKTLTDYDFIQNKAFSEN